MMINPMAICAFVTVFAAAPACADNITITSDSPITITQGGGYEYRWPSPVNTGFCDYVAETRGEGLFPLCLQWEGLPASTPRRQRENKE